MIIRKISVGPDYMNSMHFIVGLPVMDKTYKIETIVVDGSGYHVWVKKVDEVILWKSFNLNMPISVEYNIDF